MKTEILKMNLGTVHIHPDLDKYKESVQEALQKHSEGKWDKTSDKQRLKNDSVLFNNEGIARTYHVVKGTNRKVRFKIITIPKANVTVILPRNIGFEIQESKVEYHEIQKEVKQKEDILNIHELLKVSGAKNS